MWKLRIGERDKGTVGGGGGAEWEEEDRGGRGWGEREIERGVTEWIFFPRGLVFWISTSQLCVCVCV